MPETTQKDFLFDQCLTGESIESALREYVLRLIGSTGQEIQTVKTDSLLRILCDLSATDFCRYSDPLTSLALICRLLIKKGTPDSFSHCLRLSHSLHTMERNRGKNHPHSRLFKGISQIGLRLTDIGIKNVVICLSKSETDSLTDLDQCMGYWALMSAAIATQNLKTALKFAKQWLFLSQSAGLTGERFRAELVICLLHLIYGNTDQFFVINKDNYIHIPEQWRYISEFLNGWTENQRFGELQASKPCLEPCPLIAGINWLINDENTGNNFLSKNFAALCDLRRRNCREELIPETLSPEEIERFAVLFAEWELSKPLAVIEELMRQKSPEVYCRYTMTRLLGKYMLAEMMGKKPTDPENRIVKDAIVLSTDVRNYSKLSEYAPVGEIIDYDLVNPLFKMMNREFEKAGGTILEFVGDRIVVVFNTFRNQQSDIREILTASVECLKRIRTFSMLSRVTGLPEIRVGIGINQGPVAIGYIGGLSRCTLTVLGEGINLAARIESATKTLAVSDILISRSCFQEKNPDSWKEPLAVNFRIRDLGKHPMKNIRKPVHLYGVNPILNYWIDFVPMGFVAHAEKGVVYLDTGNSGEPGIIDHHFPGHQTKSACELLVHQPELLLGHVQGIPSSEIEFRVHTQPDLDCAASLYTAFG